LRQAAADGKLFAGATEPRLKVAAICPWGHPEKLIDKGRRVKQADRVFPEGDLTSFWWLLAFGVLHGLGEPVVGGGGGGSVGSVIAARLGGVAGVAIGGR